MNKYAENETCIFKNVWVMTIYSKNVYVKHFYAEIYIDFSRNDLCYDNYDIAVF